MSPPVFDPRAFLPYLLNQAADKLSLDFQDLYKREYGLLRTEWRVLFHLGCYGDMTAKEICDRARIHKTKTSRAVAKLEARRWLVRREAKSDRRSAVLSLTPGGQKVFDDLRARAVAFNEAVLADLSDDEARIIKAALLRLAGMGS